MSANDEYDLNVVDFGRMFVDWHEIVSEDIHNVVEKKIQVIDGVDRDTIEDDDRISVEGLDLIWIVRFVRLEETTLKKVIRLMIDVP